MLSNLVLFLDDLRLNLTVLTLHHEDRLLLLVDLPFPLPLDSSHFDVFLSELLFEGEEFFLELLFLVFNLVHVFALCCPLPLHLRLRLLDHAHLFFHLIVEVVLEEAK